MDHFALRVYRKFYEFKASGLFAFGTRLCFLRGKDQRGRRVVLFVFRFEGGHFYDP